MTTIDGVDNKVWVYTKGAPEVLARADEQVGRPASKFNGGLPLALDAADGEIDPSSATLSDVESVPAVPGAVSAIIAALHDDLQRRYKVARTAYRLGPDEALVSSLRWSMDAQDYQAVDRFFKGAGFEEAAQYGRPIHDRLLMALRRRQARARVTRNRSGRPGDTDRPQPTASGRLGRHRGVCGHFGRTGRNGVPGLIRLPAL
jgi:hypothetical protein